MSEPVSRQFPEDPPPSAIGAPGAGPDPDRRFAHQERRVLTLLELGQEISRPQDQRAVCSVGLLTLMGYVGTSRAALWVSDEDNPGVFRIADSHGVSDHAKAGTGPGLARLAALVATGVVPAVANLSELDRVVDDITRALLHESGLEVLGALVSRDDVQGFVALGQPVAAGPTWSVDRQLFGAACSMLAVAMANTRLIERLRTRSEDLARANRELAELDQLKSEFLQTINHELRTPLAVILGATSCLRNAPAGQPGLERFHEMISNQAVRLNEMIQSLLDFGSVTSHQLSVARKPVDVQELVRVYHRNRAPKVEQNGRRLEHVASRSPIVALGDWQRVAEILERLVDNATRFTPVGTRIVMRDSLDGEWAVIEVEDDGPGIPQERLDRIFRPFEQVDGGATRTIGGLGLGLAAARALAEAMGGQLDATSVPGRGSAFRLRLPLS